MTNKLNEQLKKMYNLSKVIDENYLSDGKTEEEIMLMIDNSIEVQEKLLRVIYQTPNINKEKLKSIYARKMADADLIYPGNTSDDKGYGESGASGSYGY